MAVGLKGAHFEEVPLLNDEAVGLKGPVSRAFQQALNVASSRPATLDWKHICQWNPSESGFNQLPED